MRTYLSPIGYDSTRVTRPVLSHGLDSGDTVVLLRPDEEAHDSRADGAVGDVERLVTEIEPDVSISLERIPVEEFPEATVACSDLLEAATGEVVVNFSGGPREVFLPFAVASLAHVTEIDHAFLFSDVSGDVRSIDLPHLRATVSASERDTLATIASTGGALTVPELTAETDRSKSTVVRHVSALEEGGFLTSWREGKTKHVELTVSGELYLRSAS